MALFSVCLVGSLWIYQEYDKFNKEIVELKNDYMDSQKSLIREQVERVLFYIDFNIAHFEQELKETMQSRVYEASAIANNLYQSYRGKKSDEEIKEMIKEAIRPLVFNEGRGYYFIYDMQGNNVLLPFSPQLEGQNLWDHQDSKGKYTIREASRMVQEDGEGFQRWFWYKPEEPEIMYEKIGFHKYFEPFDWWIGTGDYLVDFQQDIKTRILAWVNEIRYGEDGYIFIYDFEGTIKAHFLKEALNTNIKDANDDYGVYVVEELIKNSQQAEGGFFNYEGKIRPTTGLRGQKIAYSKAVKDWRWAVSAGVYVDEINDIIDLKRDNLAAKVRSDILSILIILFVSLIVIGFVLKYISKKTVHNIAIFNNFFDQVLSKSLKIDEGKIYYSEFKSLAHSANQMLDERNKVEEDLRHLQNYLSNIINSMPSVIVGVNNAGKVTQWNKIAEETIGILARDAHGKDLAVVIPWLIPEISSIFKSIDAKQIWQTQKKPRHLSTGLHYEDYTIYPLIDNGVSGAVIRIDDVTEQMRMEEMMVQNEKMLSVGGLAAGMAHEINNPLAGIMQTCEVLINRLGKNLNIPESMRAADEAGTNIDSIAKFMEARSVPRMLETMRVSGRRVAEIVDNMLSFSRKSEAVKSSHKVDRILDQILELAATDYDLKREYDFKLIDVIKRYDTDLPPAICEASKIQQVVLNIIRNGAQAMQVAKTENPTLEVKTYFDEKKEMVCIDIKDNGPGMDEATKKKVFEPFFTTKPIGMGTGLGLSISYFIITENHSGEMEVDSHIGMGTTFIIRLPIGG